MDEVKLLPCPFCGSAAIIQIVRARSWMARCGRACDVNKYGKTKLLTIAAWNARVNTRPTLVTGQLDQEVGVPGSRPLRVIGHSTAGPLYETLGVGEGIFIASDGTLRVAKTGDAHPQPGPSK